MSGACPKCGRYYGEGDPHGQFHKCDCFPAGTQIRTASGCRAIETFKKGEKVLTISGNLPKMETVQIVREHHPVPIWVIHVRGRDKSIRTTAAHSFKTMNGFKDVAHLKTGDSLTLLLDGRTREMIIDGVHPTNDVEPVFNLIVTGSATFIAEDALVHSFTNFRTLRTVWTNLMHRIESVQFKRRFFGRGTPYSEGN